jgi:hypothetical protein
MDWNGAPQLGPAAPEGEAATARVAAQILGELEHFLPLDEPSVLECFNATEQAKQAIAEEAAQEQASRQPDPLSTRLD